MSTDAPSPRTTDAVAPEAAPRPPTRGVLISRWAAVLCCGLLIAIGLGWELLWAPTGRGTLAIKVLPLVLALPGLWRMRLYTYRWLSLAVWIYVVEASVRLGIESATVNLLAGAEMLLSVLLFTACALHVRHRLAAGRRLAAPPAT
ncbi:putative membrane protein [Sphaerotilus hippei]|uniref:Putative membrane protein n=1 Tax=Sphaerotilus hippei TaxID=744406 RepID=A0A318HAB3_9BURK|nr:DUF2069 domain-containing protein [Sphaerotilus hippei]PXW95515.1 putative membrane protein [Sphaerotilus hippei]